MPEELTPARWPALLSVRSDLLADVQAGRHARMRRQHGASNEFQAVVIAQGHFGLTGSAYRGPEKLPRLELQRIELQPLPDRRFRAIAIYTGPAPRVRSHFYATPLGEPFNSSPKGARPGEDFEAVERHHRRSMRPHASEDPEPVKCRYSLHPRPRLWPWAVLYVLAVAIDVHFKTPLSNAAALGCWVLLAIAYARRWIWVDARDARQQQWTNPSKPASPRP